MLIMKSYVLLVQKDSDLMDSHGCELDEAKLECPRVPGCRLKSFE
jgi:hypothetical protein